jgi:hypothetical protein
LFSIGLLTWRSRIQLICKHSEVAGQIRTGR